MKTNGKILMGVVLGVALAAFCAFPALAQQKGATVKAGFTDLPLRNCEGTYCGELQKLPIGQSLTILYNGGDGWAQVEVTGTGKTGWVCLANTY